MCAGGGAALNSMDELPPRYPVVAYHLAAVRNRCSAQHRMRVIFLVQNVSIWGNQSPIYDALVRDSTAEVIIVLLPSHTANDVQAGMPIGGYDETYWHYFHDRYTEVYDYTNLMDLHLLQPDYIFIASPYEELRALAGTRNADLVQMAKLCYVDYGVPSSQYFLHIWAEKLAFYDYLSFHFCDSAEEQAVMNAAHPYTVGHGVQHFELLGYPAYERCLTYRPQPRAWRRILWTPRWTAEGAIGGSHFFAFKDCFTAFAVRHGSTQLRFAIRPHPLMFAHFVQQGMMTEAEVRAYKELLKAHDIELDEEQYDLFDALTATDILLTDFSSINMLFFLLNRPMIYCPNGSAPTEDYAKMAEGSYIAEDWTQAEAYLIRLIRGEDPLRVVRTQHVEAFRSLHVGAADRIVRRLKEDYAASSSAADVHLPEVERWLFGQKRSFVPLLLRQPTDALHGICTEDWYEPYLSLLPLRFHDESLQWGEEEILSVLRKQYDEGGAREQRAFIVMAMLLFADPLTLPVPWETDLLPEVFVRDVRRVFRQYRRIRGIV